MTWYTLYSRTLTTSNDRNGLTLREAIPVIAYSIGSPSVGTKLRCVVTAGDVRALSITSIYIGHAAGSGDAVDFDTTQVPLLVSGSGSFTVPISGSTTTDGVTYAFDKTKALVVSAAITFPGNTRETSSAGDSTLFYTTSGAGVSDVVATSLAPANAFIAQIEVWQDDPPGNPTCTINKATTQVDPTSGTTIEFRIQFNKGVTGLLASEIITSASTVTGTLVPVLTGSDLGYTVSVTGMLTAGNVIASVPPGCCIDSLGNLNDASTSTDNVVGWDPDIINPATPNVFDVAVVDRNILRIEVREPLIARGAYQTLVTPDSGTGTFTVTGAVANAHGLIRLTTSYAPFVAANTGYYILTMANNGAGKIRVGMYDTSLLGATVLITHSHGCTEANATWPITVIDGTHFDLVGSTFTHAYTGGGVINATAPDKPRRIVVHSVGGCTEANSAWIPARSGTNTIDLADSVFVNAYTSGGTVIETLNSNNAAGWVQRINPSTGNTDYCLIVGRFGNTLKFQDRVLAPSQYLNRQASAVAANYAITGGLTVTNVYRKVKAYSTGFWALSTNYSQPTTSFRHYIYLKLSGNLVSGNSYTITFPPGTGLPPKTLAFNDKTTRCCAIHVDQNGHRPSDVGKLGYLSEWVPDQGAHGEWDFSAITDWHIIDSGGSIVWSAGAAPTFRIGPTTREAASYAGGVAQSPVILYRDELALKVASISKFSPGHVVVDDASSLTNGDVISFSGLTHWLVGGGGHSGMVEAEIIPPDNANAYYEVTNKSGNAFDLGCPKSVTSATVAVGGSGYSVGNTISLANGVVLSVATLSGSAVATVTPVANDPAVTTATGKIGYPYTLPTNPRPQVTTSGSGTGATFNLTWADNPYDRTLVATGINAAFGNPDTSAFTAFGQSITGDQGNLCYKINLLGNRAGTNVYSLNYTPATLTTGTYYVYLPNRGVSDPIHITDAAWYNVATCYLKGLYHESQGRAIDGRFGYTRGVGLKSRAGARIYKSYMPYAFNNYTNYRVDGSVQLPDIPSFNTFLGRYIGTGEGGGYDPWITTTEMTAFGGHQDAGDWDVRISETSWYYWQILESFQHLTAPVQASLAAQGTPTLLESGLDPVIYAGTDSMPSPVVEAIWGLEFFRASQEVSGAVWGGLNYGEGVPDAELSTNTTESLYAWYPDHLNTFQYVFPAAKLARVLSDLGYTALAATWRASAIAAYDWATLIHTDTAARDAYYLPVKTIAGYTTPQYDLAISGVQFWVPAARSAAAAGLFALTGTAAYGTYYESVQPNIDGPLGVAAFWEYQQAAGADIAIKTAQKTNLINYMETTILSYSEAPDVSYCGPFGMGQWSMAFGGGNNLQYASHVIFAAKVFAEAPRSSPTDAARCRAALEKWFAHRHGANQIGLCLANGLGVRNNLGSLHLDSLSSAQEAPAGICSEGWSNLYPVVGITFGDSSINAIQQPQADPVMVGIDATAAYREMYPYDQKAWPRFEMFLECPLAIEHAEFTTQQQITPAYAAALYLHGWDGNTVTGGLETSTSVLVSSLNPSNAGDLVTFTCTVSGLFGTPTGTVTFKDAGVTIGTGTLDGSGITTFPTTALVPGTHSITGVYAGDSTYDASTSNAVSQVVNGLSTSTVLVSSLNPSPFGTSVTFTATVTSSGTPTGTVTFKDAGVAIGTGTISAGVAAFTTTILAVASHAITAVYGGDTANNPSTSNTVTEVITSAGPLTLLPQACM